MSHTNVENHKGYDVHGTSEKHDSGKWIGSFHVARNGLPVISISVLDAEFGKAEEAAEHALQRGRRYIDNMKTHD